MSAGDDPATRLRENATAVASMAVTAIWLGAMFTGQSWWLAALLVGYVLVVPLVAILFGDEEDREEWVDDWTSDGAETADSADRETTADALETLRDRYARGELTEEQFERKLERLLETETVEDVEESVRGRRAQRDRDVERER